MKKEKFMESIWGFKDIVKVCGSDLKDDMQELDRLRIETKEKDELIKNQQTQIIYQENKINALTIEIGVYVDLRR